MGLAFFLDQCAALYDLTSASNGTAVASAASVWCLNTPGNICCGICANGISSFGQKVGLSVSTLISTFLVIYDSERASSTLFGSLLQALAYLVTFFVEGVKAEALSRFHANYSLLASFGFLAPLAAIAVTPNAFLYGRPAPEYGDSIHNITYPGLRQSSAPANHSGNHSSHRISTPPSHLNSGTHNSLSIHDTNEVIQASLGRRKGREKKSTRFQDEKEKEEENDRTFLLSKEPEVEYSLAPRSLKHASSRSIPLHQLPTRSHSAPTERVSHDSEDSSNDSDHHEVHTNGKHREEEQQEAEASQARSGSRRAPAYQQEPDSEEDDDDKSFATAPEGSSSHGHRSSHQTSRTSVGFTPSSGSGSRSRSRSHSTIHDHRPDTSASTRVSTGSHSIHDTPRLPAGSISTTNSTKYRAGATRRFLYLFSFASLLILWLFAILFVNLPMLNFHFAQEKCPAPPGMVIIQVGYCLLLAVGVVVLFMLYHNLNYRSDSTTFPHIVLHGNSSKSMFKRRMVPILFGLLTSIIWTTTLWTGYEVANTDASPLLPTGEYTFTFATLLGLAFSGLGLRDIVEAFIARRKAKKESLEKKAKEEAQAAGWDEVPRRGSGSTASRVRMRQRVLGLE